MRRKNISSLNSRISSRTPSAKTALVCERAPKASVHYGAYERARVESQQSRSLQLWTCSLAFGQKAPALTSKRIFNPSSLSLIQKTPLRSERVSRRLAREFFRESACRRG